MTTADILTRISSVNSYELPYPAKAELDALAAALAEKIRQETAASRGVGSATATLSRMLKKAEKEGLRPALACTWQDADGRQLMTDGYRAYRLKNPLPLPVKPDELEAPNIASIIDDAKRRENILVGAPDVKALKAHIAIEKAANGRKHIPLWDFGPGLPAVNAEYLLDMLTVFRDAKIYAAREKCMFCALYIESKDGDGVLLPVRDAKKMAREERAASMRETLRAAERNRNTLSLEAFDRIAAALAGWHPETVSDDAPPAG